MAGVALDLEVIAGESVRDVALDVLGRGIGHGIGIIPQAPAPGTAASTAPRIAMATTTVASTARLLRRGQSVDTSSTAVIVPMVGSSPRNASMCTTLGDGQASPQRSEPHM